MSTASPLHDEGHQSDLHSFHHLPGTGFWHRIPISLAPDSEKAEPKETMTVPSFGDITRTRNSKMRMILAIIVLGALGLWHFQSLAEDHDSSTLPSGMLTERLEPEPVRVPKRLSTPEFPLNTVTDISKTKSPFSANEPLPEFDAKTDALKEGYILAGGMVVDLHGVPLANVQLSISSVGFGYGRRGRWRCKSDASRGV